MVTPSPSSLLAVEWTSLSSPADRSISSMLGPETLGFADLLEGFVEVLSLDLGAATLTAIFGALGFFDDFTDRVPEEIIVGGS